MLVSKTQVKIQEKHDKKVTKIENASETMQSVMRPLRVKELSLSLINHAHLDAFLITGGYSPTHCNHICWKDVL